MVSVRSLHLLVGAGGVLAFLGTGAWMATHFPGAYAGGETIRYMYRANHVYLLLASLVNLAIGMYRVSSRPGWRTLTPGQQRLLSDTWRSYRNNAPCIGMIVEKRTL